MKKKFISILAIFSFFGIFAFFSTPKVFATLPEKPSAYYLDQPQILNTKTKDLVENVTENYNKTKKKPQVVLAVVKTTDGDSVDSYAPDLFSKWGIGNKAEDNGVLILYAVNSGARNVRIEVGYGLEDVLTDATTMQILKNSQSDLKSNDASRINKGLQKVFNSVTNQIDKKYDYHASKEKVYTDSSSQKNHKGDFWLFIIFIVLVILFSGGSGGGSNGSSGPRYRRRYYGGYYGGPFGGSSSSGGFGDSGGFGGFGGGSSGGGGSSI